MTDYEKKLLDLQSKRKIRMFGACRTVLQTESDFLEKASKIIENYKPKIQELDKQFQLTPNEKITKEGFLYFRTGGNFCF